jgi:peroxiredoxin
MIPKNIAEKAHDFERLDSQGRMIKLSEYRNKLNLVLVFNRGFG